MTIISTATSADEALRASLVAVLPVGSYEQHGAHLPLATDTIVACMIAAAVAEAHGLMLLPPITVGCSHEHAGWSGTVSIRAATLALIIHDIAESLHQSGVEKLVIVNGHGGNYVLSNVVQEANVSVIRMALYPGRDDWNTARASAGLISSAHDDMHAGEIETSLLLHAHPDLVRAGYEQADHLADRPHLLMLGMAGYTPTGVIGSPSLATPAKGAEVLNSLTSTFIETLRLFDHPAGTPTATSSSSGGPDDD
jgi:creatinine amidohydrolase